MRGFIIDRTRTVVIVMVTSTLVMASCGSTSAGDATNTDDVGLTTDTRSSSISGEQAKIDFLDRYAMLPSPVIETEFHIVYRDNSRGVVPGPSDWTIEFVARIDPVDAELWTAEISPIDEPSDWDEELLDGWAVDGATPQFYGRAGTVRAVYGDDVILQLSRTT